jgi:hypothetical protein
VTEQTAKEDRSIDPRALTICLVLALAPFSRALLVVDNRPGEDYAKHTLVFAVDLALAGIVVQQMARLPQIVRAWRTHAAAVAALALAVSLTPGLLAHPGDRGVAAVLRLIGVVAIASALPQLGTPERRLVACTAATVLAVSAVVAIAQLATGGPVGLQAVGEDAAGVLPILAGRAPFGLFVHPYVEAAWAVVVGLGLAGLLLRPRHRFTAPLPLVALGLAPLGLTLCRSAVLAALAGGVPLLYLALRTADRRRALVVIGGLTLAVGAAVVWNADGWLSRADNTVSSGDPGALRGSLFRQARGLLEDDPIVGVGPGNYVLALQERPDLKALNPQPPRPVHSVPALVVVEGGLVALPGVLLLIAAIMWQARRAGAVGWVLVGSFAPFLLLDHLAWSFPQGLVLTGLWLGLLDLVAVSEPPGAPA